MTDTGEWLYRLPRGLEIEPGVYRRHWRPIKNATWNAYTFTQGPRWWFEKCYLGIHWWKGNLGLNDYYCESRCLRIGFGFICFEVWVFFNIYDKSEWRRKVDLDKEGNLWYT